MAEIYEIIPKLIERTDQDKLPWQTTADEETFVAVVGNLSVSIAPRGYHYFFQVLNEEGREIEHLYTALVDDIEAQIELQEMLSDLYGKAKRNALQVDSKLDELLTELTKDI